MKIHYVTGSRADFGLMRHCLDKIASEPGLDLALVVTGQHLLSQYGNTVHDIEAAGLQIAGRIPVALSGGQGAEMAVAMADELRGFVSLWQRDPPDLVLVLGDRGEMLAAALAAVHLGIHVAHLHGGELSGTLDESFRHAISKLSHIHLTSYAGATERLVRMGEDARHVYTVGAPGLVGLTTGLARQSGYLEQTYGLSAASVGVVCVFHPVVQEQSDSASQVTAVLNLLERQDAMGLVMRPNSDAGGAAIDAALNDFVTNGCGSGRFRVIEHLSREQYLNSVFNSDLILGNSSSGIIESASLGVPCLNLGSRQTGRFRNENVVDCESFDAAELDRHFTAAVAMQGPFENAFGDGRTDETLVKLFTSLNLTPEMLAKGNTF